MSRLNRRVLFTSGAAAALLSATGVSLQARPQRGGHLRIAVTPSDTGVLPIAHRAVFETLTEIAPDGVLRGRLATDWSTNETAQSWHLTLRDQVRFHDGSTCDAAAIAACLDPEALGARRIEAAGPTSLLIELQTGDPQLPYALADANLALRSATGSGTGLYRTERESPGRSFLGHRVDRHYRDGEAGWADTVEIIAFSSSAVRTEALRDGDLQICLGLRISPSTAARQALGPDAPPKSQAGRGPVFLCWEL